KKMLKKEKAEKLLHASLNNKYKIGITCIKRMYSMFMILST
ncbi:17183_t:CDS:1, partial [Gigaspora rosea]